MKQNLRDKGRLAVALQVYIYSTYTLEALWSTEEARKHSCVL